MSKLYRTLILGLLAFTPLQVIAQINPAIAPIISYLLSDSSLNQVVDRTKDDHGNDIETATLLSINSSTNGRIEIAGDIDYFKISLPNAGRLLIESLGSSDMFGSLLDSNGSILYENDDEGINKNFKISKSVTSGIYYIKVRNYSKDKTGNYSLNIKFTSDVSVQKQKVVLLLHGLGSNHETWNTLKNNFFDKNCKILSAYPSSIISLDVDSDIKCYTMNFGTEDISGNLTGLEQYNGTNKSCASSNGCKGDYSTFNTLGKEVKTVVGKILHEYNDNAEIILLGHSRGGLAARVFLQTPVPNDEKKSIVGLITTGTPHKGSPLGRFYSYMQEDCSYPRTDHDNNNPFVNADCEDDWELVDSLRLRIAGLDLYSPSIGFLSPESNEISDIKNNISNLPSIQYRQMVYSKVGLGYLDLKFQILVNGGTNEPTAAGRYSILQGQSPYDYSGDGIVPSSSQRFSKEEFRPKEDTKVLHAKETKRIYDLSSTLNDMYHKLGWK